MRQQNNYRKSGHRRRRLFDIEVYDPRKDSFQKRFRHRGLSWDEVEWIKFHPYLRVTSIKPSLPKEDEGAERYRKQASANRDTSSVKR